MSDAMEALEKFQNDIDGGRLKKLDEWTRDFNCFEILRITETEIRHSNVLAWLLDPHENHGLGSAVLEQFLKCLNEELIPAAADELNSNPTPLSEPYLHEFKVFREWSNIDLLLAAEDGSLEIAIENKTRSGEHDDQLNRYRETLEQNRDRSSKPKEVCFVYLTPEGAPPSDPEHWIPMSYESVVGVIEKALEASEIEPQTEAFISQYLETIRKRVMPDQASHEEQELKAKCLEIYRSHQQAIDLIVQHIPDRTAEVRSWVWNWAQNQEGQNGLEFDGARSKPYLLKFTSKAVSEYLPETPGCQSTWGSDYHCCFELDNRSTDYFFFMFTLDGKLKNDEDESDEFEQLLKDFERIDMVAWEDSDNKFRRGKRIRRKNWHHRTYCESNSLSVNSDTTEKEIVRELEAMAKEVQECTAELLKQALGEHESSLV